MGMAASQARYLALTARKSNCEYEGQQINQARTALANQSANFYNQMLNMKVPTAPSTSDYTKTQYSYSDDGGESTSVLDDWTQLSTADSNYNYIVNHYYNTNLYTGSQKTLQNPQVSVKGTAQATPNVSLKKNDDGTYTYQITDPTTGTTTEKTVNYMPVKDYGDNDDLKNSIQDLASAGIIEEVTGQPDTTNLKAYKDSDNVWHFIVDDGKSEHLDEDGNPIDYSTQYNPTAIGNCTLTELTKEDLYTTKDGVTSVSDTGAELTQVLKDCSDTNMSKYLSIKDGQLDYDSYTGGIYKFTMNGKTYYTDKADLINSLGTNMTYGKSIDDQDPLKYYNASYVSTKVEEKNKALLETDSSGRFTSVKFDDDSVVYSLNVETVTDEDAYNDAMNQYNYQVRQYEKTIADINAKTSIIQQEDRTLELRLKQLDTEQNALKTEMEAVKKVIKDNVEATFKTFSD